MGLFFSSKKPMMSLPSKLGMSSAHPSGNAPAHNKNGRVTSYEFKHQIRHALTETFGHRKGAEIRNILGGNMDVDGSHGHGITGREIEATLKSLRNNHGDNLSPTDIKKLEGIIDSQL